jgi:hypothetical protein
MQAKQLSQPSSASADEQSVKAAVQALTSRSRGRAVPDFEDLDRWMDCPATARLMLREAAQKWAAMTFVTAGLHEALMAALLDRWQLLDWLEVRAVNHCGLLTTVLVGSMMYVRSAVACMTHTVAAPASRPAWLSV